MALIWSKKSSGMPVTIESAHSTDPNKAPEFITRCVLDIDISRNEPKVIEHIKMPNPDGWRGTSITVVVGGNWTNYRSRIMTYLQQLAIITPYAELELTYRSVFFCTKF